jgi:hypothetical protein
MLVKLLDANANVVSMVDYADAEIGIERMTEAGFKNVHVDPLDMDIAKKMSAQNALRKNIYGKYDIDSLLGKTANALSAALNIQLKIFSALATAQSIDDVRNAALIAAPLMTLVSGKLERGELLSVQAAQGMSDEDSIVEALEAMTQVAQIIQSK